MYLFAVVMDCGTIISPKMRIIFRGEAFRIYATDNGNCRAYEREPAIFEIVDARQDENCPVRVIVVYCTYHSNIVVANCH